LLTFAALGDGDGPPPPDKSRARAAVGDGAWRARDGRWHRARGGVRGDVAMTAVAASNLPSATRLRLRSNATEHACT